MLLDGRDRPDQPAAVRGAPGPLAAFARHGLDAPSFDVLAALRRAGPPYQLTATALMRTALVTSGAITQRLDRQEECGLVTGDAATATGGPPSPP